MLRAGHAVSRRGAGTAARSARPGRCCAPARVGARRRAPLRVAALLQREPAAAPGSDGDGEGARLERARQAIARLLGPSLAERDAGAPPEAAPAAPGAPADPAPTPCDAGCVWHFAYGANMAFRTLARRDVRPLSRDAAMVVDPSVRMCFKHRGGYATLESMPLVPSHSSSPGSGSPGASPSGTGTVAVGKPAAGAPPPPQQQQQQQQQPEQEQQEARLLAPARPRYPPFNAHVHGVLYKVREEDMAKLVKVEGGYVIKELEVETYDGRRVLAQTFVSGPLAALPAEVPPTEKYMRALREGAADNYLDPLHQAWLSSIETVSSAGLGAEYFNTPSKWVAYGFLAVAALLVVGFVVQH